MYLPLTIRCLAIIFTGLLPVFSMAANEQQSPMEAWSKARSAADFSGSILIAKGDDIVFERGFGLADKENNSPFSADTLVDVLSLTKQFTAAAILKLEDQGALSVNDTLDQFFDDVPKDKKNISLHQLLNHTSGLKGNYKWDYRKVTRAELEDKVLNSRLRSTPGEKYHYSNVGYSLLGIIIEKVSGKGYEAFLHEQLFKPAGMSQTGYRIPEWESKNLAVGYRSRAISFGGWLARAANWLGADDRWGTPLDQYWAEDGPWWNLRANGGLLSTVHDLYRWHLALKNNLVLSEEAKRKLHTPPHINSGDKYYGYGWLIKKNEAGITAMYHTGGNPYFFSLFHHDISNDLLLLFATNDWNSVDGGQFYGLDEAMMAEFADNKNVQP